jgi:HK97 family phage major capsid protein
MIRSLQLREERAKLFAQAQALIPAEGRMSAENNATFDTIMADVDKMKAEIDRLERAESVETEMRAVRGMEGGDPANPSDQGGSEPSDKEVEARQKKYRSAYGNYLRRGLNGVTAEDLSILRGGNVKASQYRDLDNTVGAAGMFTIPTGFQKELDVALKYYGGMRSVARILHTSTGATFPWPTTNDTNNKGRRLGANATKNPAVENDQSFGQVTFNAYTYTTDVIKIPNELLLDSAFDLESEVRDRFAERIARIHNYEFTVNNPAQIINSNPNGGPNGLLNVIPVGVTGAAGEVSSYIYDDLIDLIHSIDPAYRQDSSIMFSDIALSVIRKMKDNYGRPLFGPGLNGEEPDTICGKKYVINQDMPVPAANAVSMAFGNFKKYIIRDIADSMVIVRLNELYALNNETGFVGFVRSEGQLVDAGTHPIKSFQHPAA